MTLYPGANLPNQNYRGDSTVQMTHKGEYTEEIETLHQLSQGTDGIGVSFKKKKLSNLVWDPYLAENFGF
uniref:Uncharacterized protein n=1 Tax=Rhizophora mucronata TaxID=61149 RepID=A0A2P2PZ17_RHIMU